jgi:hypothetical protein
VNRSIGSLSVKPTALPALKCRPSSQPISPADGLATVMPLHTWTERLHPDYFPWPVAAIRFFARILLTTSSLHPSNLSASTTWPESVVALAGASARAMIKSAPMFIDASLTAGRRRSAGNPARVRSPID